MKSGTQKESDEERSMGSLRGQTHRFLTGKYGLSGNVNGTHILHVKEKESCMKQSAAKLFWLLLLVVVVSPVYIIMSFNLL